MREQVQQLAATVEGLRTDHDPRLLVALADRGVERRLARLELAAEPHVVARAEPALLPTEEHLRPTVVAAEEVGDADAVDHAARLPSGRSQVDDA
nr:hypothetical protein GCM10025699_57810 [Microbacterium flavescens]